MSIVPKGLDGVVVDESAICLADKTTDRLYYRGYAIEDLAQHATYEEVAYLLLNGDLPSAAALDAYKKSIAAQRRLPTPLKAVLAQLRTSPSSARTIASPIRARVMSALRHAPSYRWPNAEEGA